MSERFTTEEDDVLIDLVRRNPPLYSENGKTYQDLVVKNNIWKEIGTAMKKNEKACQKRWKNIRDYYQKKKRGVRKGQRPGSARTFNQLSFLDNKWDSVSLEPQNVPSEAEAALSDMEDYPDVEDCKDSIAPNKQEPQEDQDTVVEQPTISATTFCICKTESVPNEEAFAVVEEIKKVQVERNNLIKELLSQFRNETKGEDTPISTFFRSIAMTVEQLPPDLQTRAKVKVLHVISELEFENQQRDCSFHGVSARPS